MKMWIQLHNFTAKEMDGANASQAKEALATFDWMSELEKRAQSNWETCDPGLGLVSEDGSILHICPRDAETCFVNYHHDVPRKILGFIPSSSPETHYIEACSFETAAELIDHHFNGDAEGILKVK